MNEIVKEYGAGLYALAHESGDEDEILEESRVLAPLFDRAYTRLLVNPDIPKSERVRLAGEAVDGRVHPYLANFVKLMVERNLATELPGCFAEYENLWCAENRVIRVRCESAVALDDGQKARLAERLEARTGSRVRIEYAVDPSLLGGMRLFYDNRQIDDTVKNRLREIAGRLSGANV